MFLKRIGVIGSSAGGPRILKEIFTGLPCLQGSLILVQHMPKFVNTTFCESLNEITEMNVKLAEEGEYIKPGFLYIAPSELHCGLVDNRIIHLFNAEKVHYVSPSIDVAMESIKNEVGLRPIGVLLTGMGKDGAEGIAHIKDLGGVTIVQNEQTSVIWGMPKAAISTGKVDFVLDPQEIRAKLIQEMGIKR